MYPQAEGEHVGHMCIELQRLGEDKRFLISSHLDELEKWLAPVQERAKALAKASLAVGCHCTPEDVPPLLSAGLERTEPGEQMQK